jgi:hypothetical protein
MTRKQALIELRDAVKAGDNAGFRRANRTVFTTPCQDMALQMQEEHCRYAYKGSIDAAVALLEAVLPDWLAMFWLKSDDAAACIYQVGEDKIHIVGKHRIIETTADTPARACLLAILEALISQEVKE